jgi:hypothetical protein
MCLRLITNRGAQGELFSFWTDRLRTLPGLEALTGSSFFGILGRTLELV